MSDQLEPGDSITVETGDPIPDGLKPLVEEIESLLSDHPLLIPMIRQRDGAYKLASELPRQIATSVIATPSKTQRGWELIGNYYMNRSRFHESISIYNALYQHMLSHENKSGERVHKGMPLIWMSDCHFSLFRPVHAKRYLMLSLCEDAIRDKGEMRPEGGPYPRLVWQYGLFPQLVEQYFSACWRFHQTNASEGLFPERILSELSQEWMSEVPSSHESGLYSCNGSYVRHLLEQLGSDKGRSLERLAHYVVGLIPGCRAYLRKRSRSTDYDVVGLFEGPAFDFRSELGRYFVCECKDWKESANFTTLAKFCRVLDSVKSRFGILFSKEGISGAGKSTDAEREQYKVYGDRRIIIVVISKSDLDRIADGANFLSMLRHKYEQIRLDLRDTLNSVPAQGNNEGDS